MSGEREGMRFLTARCPGWGAASPPPPVGLWGIAGGGQGGGQLSPFPISPGITYRKKTGKGKPEMFTKHTSHSTVNPLDAKQTHQELLPPRAPAGPGAAALTASSRFPWFLWFGFVGLHPRCLHLRAPARSLLSRGFASAPSQALPARLGAVGSACLRSGRFWLGGRCWHSLPALPDAL